MSNIGILCFAQLEPLCGYVHFLAERFGSATGYRKRGFDFMLEVLNSLTPPTRGRLPVGSTHLLGIIFCMGVCEDLFPSTQYIVTMARQDCLNIPPENLSY